MRKDAPSVTELGPLCQHPDNVGMSEIEMGDILDLPGWKPLSRHAEGNTEQITAEFVRQPTARQKCGVAGPIRR